jgi:hypothetical protein
MSEDELSEEELAELAEAIDEAEDLAYKTEYLSAAKMPCPECGGSGTMAAGSLGGAPCLNCNGARFVDHPAMHGQKPHHMVRQIRGMRRRFQTYTRLLDWDPRTSSEPQPTQRQLAEAAAEVPTVAHVQKATIAIAKSSMALPGAPRQQRQLEGQRNPPRRHEDDWGDEWEDDEGY